MFEPVKIKKWKCKDPEKIVQTRFFTKDKMEKCMKLNFLWMK